MTLRRCPTRTRHCLFTVLLLMFFAVGCSSWLGDDSASPGGDVNTPPAISADVKAFPTKGEIPLDVSFRLVAEGGGDPKDEVNWDFGDGATGTGVTAEHSYLQAGEYTVTATTTDAKGDPLTLTASLTADVVPGDLSIRHVNVSPTRLVQGGPKNQVYVSDARVGSVFIYRSDLTLISEIKGLDRPLGVTVDAKGNIYVGNNGSNAVEVFNAAGEKFLIIREGDIRMPNDLATDGDGNIYVADSRANAVKVYSPDGKFLRSIGGDGDLRFPAALALTDSELYVADQGNSKVKVYSLKGELLRGFGEQVEAFSTDWQGKFVRLQSLAVDEAGRVHAADSYMNNIQILNAETGEFISAYGAYGEGQGQLRLPLDIIINRGGQTVVANSENHRVEVVPAAAQ